MIVASNAKKGEKMEENGKTNERKKDGKSVLEWKLNNVGNPESIVIYPHTRDGHILTKILFGYDKVINGARLAAGNAAFPIEKLKEIEAKIDIFKIHTTRLLNTLGGNGHGMFGNFLFLNRTDTLETKRMLAANRKSYVFIPRTVQGREMAQTVKTFDSLWTQFRVNVPEMGKIEEMQREILKYIVVFHGLTDGINNQIRLRKPYLPPKGMKKIENMVQAYETKVQV